MGPFLLVWFLPSFLSSFFFFPFPPFSSGIRYPSAVSATPKHVIVVGIGLHYNKAEEMPQFRADLTALAARMRLFGFLKGNFAFFQEVPPQHFKDGTSGGGTDVNAFHRRDLAANECWPWDPTGSFAHRNALLNEIVASVAEGHSLHLQRVAAPLTPRFDAHLEWRNHQKAGLDCTHWCAQVFDAFEDTLLQTLQLRFGPLAPEQARHS
jgi:hypothetical protein